MWRLLMTPPKKATELEPCPFCGGTPEYDEPSTFVTPETSKWGAVRCGCGATAPDVRTCYQDWTTWRDAAVEEWNRRATLEPEPKGRKRNG